MKIIEASYEILDRRSLSMSQKLEQAGRIAYKSEDMITDDSAEKFIMKMLNHKHYPVIEFANIHLKVSNNSENYSKLKKNIRNKFLHITENHYWIYVSGTVRAFRESINRYSALMEAIGKKLFNTYGYLFEEFKEYIDNYPCGTPTVILLSPEKLKEELKEKNLFERHLMCAVKFNHNRAFTHEIVRHRPCSFLQESQRYCRYDQDKFGNEVTFIEPSAFFEKDSKEYSCWYRAMRSAEMWYLSLLDSGMTPQAARTVLPNSCKTEIIVYATIEEWKHIFKMRCSSAAEPSMQQVMIPLEKEFWTREDIWE